MNMSNLELVICFEFMRCKLVNEGNYLNTEQLENMDNSIGQLWASVTREDLKASGDSICEYIKSVLKSNGLSFSDKRCYNYLEDSIIDLINSYF